ncbi:MAG: OmpA family protein [Bacteroidia bacterium]|nr:OmpA family protein [Bacteroidia bacterium]
MKSLNLKLISGLLAFILLVSCVPQKKLEESENKLATCKTDLDNVKKEAQDAQAKLKELQETFTKMQKDNVSLVRDTNLLGSNYRNLTGQYDKLNKTNLELMARLEKLMDLSDKANAKLSTDLQMTQQELMKKQDELKFLEAQLNKQKADLDALSMELKKREARVNELEDVLRKKDEAANALKKKLSEALFNFENKGLTISMKNGKVYVSMDESLLFASGKTAVEPKGIEALKNVAKVLEQNTDINVLVEGHTDNVPMAGKGDIKDNWDLSVMRATSVTKIMLGGATIDSKRITAAGRGEFFPIDPANTPEARKKNRRTEIILTPKLDELFKVLEGN